MAKTTARVFDDDVDESRPLAVLRFEYDDPEDVAFELEGELADVLDRVLDRPTTPAQPLDLAGPARSNYWWVLTATRNFAEDLLSEPRLEVEGDKPEPPWDQRSSELVY